MINSFTEDSKLSVENDSKIKRKADDIKNELPCKKSCLENRKKSNIKFQYGNYDRYYGYRTPNDFADPRIEIFKQHQHLFQNKDILDIGCNNGFVTLLIAKDFEIKSICGIDIDKKLIERARKNLKNHFTENVLFLRSDYVLSNEKLLELETEKYDVIVCLSVTKWMHLNNGDNGIKLAFKRIFKQLRMNGVLILEAQEWKSYKKRKNLTSKITENYKNINFKPQDFSEYLLGPEVGFSEVFDIGVPEHTCKGFRRPIKVFTKRNLKPIDIPNELN